MQPLPAAARARDHGRVYGAIERVWDVSLAAYERSLARVMRHKLATLFVSLAVLAGTVFLFGAVPKGFLPSEDTGILNGTTEGAEGLSFDGMVAHQQAAAAVVAAGSGRRGVHVQRRGRRRAVVEQSGPVLHPPEAARTSGTTSADEIVARLRGKLAQVPGLRAFVINPPAINIGGRGASSLYQFTLQSSDLGRALRGGARARGEAAREPSSCAT